MKYFLAFVCGLVFSVGLAVSGMLDTQKVLGFLDLFGDWDISLLLVMVGALAVATPGFYYLQKRSKPILDDQFFLPEKSTIDGRLLVGAVFFGVGWGLYGYCPGPAIASISQAEFDTLLFVLAMVIGMFLANRLPAKN